MAARLAVEVLTVFLDAPSDTPFGVAFPAPVDLPLVFAVVHTILLPLWRTEAQGAFLVLPAAHAEPVRRELRDRGRPELAPAVRDLTPVAGKVGGCDVVLTADTATGWHSALLDHGRCNPENPTTLLLPWGDDGWTRDALARGCSTPQRVASTGPPVPHFAVLRCLGVPREAVAAFVLRCPSGSRIRLGPDTDAGTADAVWAATARMGGRVHSPHPSSNSTPAVQWDGAGPATVVIALPPNDAPVAYRADRRTHVRWHATHGGWRKRGPHCCWSSPLGGARRVRPTPNRHCRKIRG